MDIQHVPEQNKFVVREAGAEAYVAYQITGGDIDFVSTFVPEALRKRGIAEALVRAAIAWAKTQNYNMTASCWYAAKFLR